MNYEVNPQRIIATNIRTTAAQLEAWRDLYALTYQHHRQSFNAWLVSMINAGLPIHADRIQEAIAYLREEASK